MKKIKPSFLFFLLALATRLPFADRYLYHMDSGHFAFALDRYDVSVHQPHPPGYFLYVMLGRVFRLLTGDANAALVLMSAVFSGAAVALVFHMGDRMFGRRAGVAAAVIALVSPMLWLHGIVALSYAAEGFFSLLVAWLCWRLIKGEGAMLWASAVALGAAAGFRQSSLMFLLPLWLYAVRRQGAKRIMLALALLCASVLAWFLPMVYLTGGYRAYMDALGAHAGGLPFFHDGWPSMALHYARLQSIYVIWGLAAALVPLARFFIFRKKRGWRLSSDREMPVFFLVWLTPSFLFYVFVHSSLVNPGYCLVYLAGIFLLAGRAVTAETEGIGRSGHAWVYAVSFIAAFNTLAFFFAPFWLSYRGVQGNNRRLDACLEKVKKDFPPDSTVVVGVEDCYNSYRHAAYYLPGYTVYDATLMERRTGAFFFKCRGRDTAKSRGLELPPGTEHIVIFEPLRAPFAGSGLAKYVHTLPLREGNVMAYFDYPELARNGIPAENVLGLNMTITQ